MTEGVIRRGGRELHWQRCNVNQTSAWFLQGGFPPHATLDFSSSFGHLCLNCILLKHFWSARIKKPHSTQPVCSFAPAEEWYKAMDQVNSLTSTDCDTVFITNRHEDSTNDDTCDDRNNSRARSPTKSERKFYIESLLVNRTSQSGDACSSYQPLPTIPASSVKPYPKSSKTWAADLVVHTIK